MPAMFNVSKQDLLRSKTVQPGWYPAVIKSVTQKAAKTDGSTNTIVTFNIQGGTYDGVPIDALFSEKAPGFASPLIAAILGRPLKAEGEGVDLEFGVGKKIMIYVKNDIYQGRTVNKAEDYKPL